MEFNEVREYIPGDDVRAIDWNVTARMGHPYIKKFVEERELTVFLLVDISASGDFGSRGTKKNEQAAELAALLAFNAIRNNDQVGLILFTNNDELHLPSRKGRRHVLRLIRELIACERKQARTDIKRALEIFMQVNRRRTVIFLISDFIDSGYESTLTIANKKHDIIAIRILDPKDLMVPPMGYVHLEDAETGKTLIVDTGDRRMVERLTQLRRQEFQERRKQFHTHGVDLIEIRTDRPLTQPLIQFFKMREKRH